MGPLLRKIGREIRQRVILPSGTLRKHFYEIQYRKWDRAAGDPILVYQMGKVGSTTVINSLAPLNLGRPILHLHTLRQENVRRLLADPKSSKSIEPWESQYILGRMSESGAKTKWDVITLIREPVSRNISAFFQTVPDLHSGFLRRPRAPDLTIEDAHRRFLDEYSHQVPHRWLDTELKDVLGIDAYAHDFPKGRGYEIYEERAVRVLLLRVEDLDSNAGQAFHEFLGLRDFTLAMDNVSAKKSYAALYAKFLETFRPPDSYLDSMYKSRYARHFYTDEEIRRFRARWENKRTDAAQ